MSTSRDHHFKPQIVSSFDKSSYGGWLIAGPREPNNHFISDHFVNLSCSSTLCITIPRSPCLVFRRIAVNSAVPCLFLRSVPPGSRSDASRTSDRLQRGPGQWNCFKPGHSDHSERIRRTSRTASLQSLRMCG